MAGWLREHLIKPLERSPEWGAVRAKHLERQPACQNCGRKGLMAGLQVHHIVPFHVQPDLELEPSNLITLCSNRECHMEKGHAGDFRSWNPLVIEDCRYWSGKRRSRPYRRGR